MLFSKKYEDLVVEASGYIQLKQYSKAEELLLKAIKRKNMVFVTKREGL